MKGAAMDAMGIKAKVLKELMDVLDAEEGAKLKKHPKLMAAKITIAKPAGKEMPEDMMAGEEMPEAGEMLAEGEDMEGEDSAEEMAEESPLAVAMAAAEQLGPAEKAKLLKMLQA